MEQLEKDLELFNFIFKMEHQHSLLKQHRECVALVFKHYGIDAPLTDQSLYLATKKFGKPFVNSLKDTISNCSNFVGLPEGTGTLTRGAGTTLGTLTPNNDLKLQNGTYGANSTEYMPRLGTEYGEELPALKITAEQSKKSRLYWYVGIALIIILILIFILLKNGKKTLK